MSEKKQKEKKPKVKLTKEQKKQRVKKHLKRTGIALVSIVVILGILVGIFAIVNVTGNKALTEMATSFEKVSYTNQLAPDKDEDGYYTFTTDQQLKILQLTDIHIGAGFMSQKKDSWALNAVAAMVTAEKPDLVVVTGDIAYPVPFQAGTFNNLNATKIFANLMESLGVYWTFTFGNHDTESYSSYTRQDICNYYKDANFKYCLFQRGSDKIDGYGNSFIKVKNSQGIVTQAIVTLDSHSYVDGDKYGVLWKYDNLHQNQVDWYGAEIDKFNAQNKNIDENASDVKSMAYFHIPLREYRTAWAQFVENGNKDTDDVSYVYGKMGEKSKENSEKEMTYGIYCGVKHDNFFKVGSEKGLQAVFCGHDHYNNFSVDYKGVRLTYGMSIDYLAYPGIYKQGAQRGCTVITVNPDGSFECSQQNYYQKKYESKFEKETPTK